MRILWVLLLLLAGSAKAELALDIHGFSKHFGAEEEYNETNPGFGLAYGGNTGKFVAGSYTNSFSGQTLYAGGEASTAGSVRVGLLMGLTYGYTVERESSRPYEPPQDSVKPSKRTRVVTRYEEKAIIPILAPFIAIGDDYSVRIMVLPETDESPMVAAISFRVAL